MREKNRLDSEKNDWTDSEKNKIHNIQSNVQVLYGMWSIDNIYINLHKMHETTIQDNI